VRTDNGTVLPSRRGRGVSARHDHKGACWAVSLLSMSGLHLVLLDRARAEGLPVEKGRGVPWLSARGHLHPVAAEACSLVLDALAAIHSSLGGDAQALAAKPPRNPPTPDLVHTDTGAIIEVDEVQHFTSARLLTLDQYPPRCHWDATSRSTGS
jgi:hypothetical protein